MGVNQLIGSGARRQAPSAYSLLRLRVSHDQAACGVAPCGLWCLAIVIAPDAIFGVPIIEAAWAKSRRLLSYAARFEVGALLCAASALLFGAERHLERVRGRGESARGELSGSANERPDGVSRVGDSLLSPW